jgi:hypothetical protein
MIATTAKSQNWEKNIASVPWSLEQKIKLKKKKTLKKTSYKTRAKLI